MEESRAKISVLIASHVPATSDAEGANPRRKAGALRRRTASASEMLYLPTPGTVYLYLIQGAVFSVYDLVLVCFMV